MKIANSLIKGTLLIALVFTPFTANASHKTRVNHHRFSITRTVKLGQQPKAGQTVAKRSAKKKRTKCSNRPRRFKSDFQYRHVKNSRHYIKVPKDLRELNTRRQRNHQVNRAERLEMNYLNQDRASLDLKLLKNDPKLDALAKERSREIVSNFNHYNRNADPSNPHSYYYYQEAPKYKLDLYYLPSGEDIAESQHHIVEPNHAAYYQLGSRAAKRMNYIMFQREKDATPRQDGTHRRNIEDKAYQRVGIGITFSPKKGYYLAEEFD